MLILYREIHGCVPFVLWGFYCIILNKLCSVYVLFFVNNTVCKPKGNEPGYGNAYLLGGCLSGSMMRKTVWGCWGTHSRCQSEVQMNAPLTKQVRLSEPGSMWWPLSDNMPMLACFFSFSKKRALVSYPVRQYIPLWYSDQFCFILLSLNKES